MIVHPDFVTKTRDITPKCTQDENYNIALGLDLKKIMIPNYILPVGINGA